MFAAACGGIFGTILKGEEQDREHAIQFLSTKLKTLPEETMTKDFETFIFEESKKVLDETLTCIL